MLTKENKELRELLDERDKMLREFVALDECYNYDDDPGQLTALG